MGLAFLAFGFGWNGDWPKFQMGNDSSFWSTVESV